MKNRPFILKGKISVKSEDYYIIGRLVKNDNTDNKSNYIQIIDKEHIDLYEDGYLGYIFIDWIPAYDLDNINYATDITNVETLINNDVIEMIDDTYIRVLYRDDSGDNFIQVTNQCNSNCIMCPDSDQVRNNHYVPDINKIRKQIRCIPDDTENICITGGEPGILKYGLVDVVRECKECLPETNFLLLSNGRIFSDINFSNEFVKNAPSKIQIAIPIYADNAILHDSITRAEGSFEEAVMGIKNLLQRNIEIEIRIVVLKQNYKYLSNIATFIAKELKNVKFVNIMALEMSGNAFKNKDNVWVNFDEVKSYLFDPVLTLLKAGIQTSLYNFPLCKIDNRLYSIAKKSISDYKVRFKDECMECKAKDYCGGFFFSTINMKEIKVNPIK
ncbi:MAG: His-Xaa-Ser system radical SAM maturase HxsC [Clostridia bacterium]|nr:His-Xaa-Ser system radical SAM maturase HxsC [Clostridia bacterium]